jgi:hypothetical protein
MTAPSTRLAPRNHLAGGNLMRAMTTMLTAIISPATLPPTGILLIDAGMRVIACVYSLQGSAPCFECTSSQPLGLWERWS